MTLADCRLPLFACKMIYRSSPAVFVLGRSSPTFLTAVPVVWNAFQARETTLLLIQNSAATLVTLWLLKLNWDEALPEHFVLKWKKLQMEFQQVCHLLIPRWLQYTNKKVTLRGFSDASEAAYACSVNAVQRDRETTKVAMLGGKSKVAPLKPICIPRLELNAALLLARFFETLCNCLKDYVINIYAWTDSQIVLAIILFKKLEAVCRQYDI
ncbi:uncharacterized protein TNCV_2704251 [Trichonephila clavipes]|nr:uncharacterized protein TNCV_2704251 [Trichonephila clavipes]